MATSEIYAFSLRLMFCGASKVLCNIYQEINTAQCSKLEGTMNSSYCKTEGLISVDRQLSLLQSKEQIVA